MNIMHVQLPLERMPKKDFLEIGTLHNCSKSHGYTDALETMAKQYAFAWKQPNFDNDQPPLSRSQTKTEHKQNPGSFIDERNHS